MSPKLWKLALFIVGALLLVTNVAFAHPIVNVNGQKDTNEWLDGFGSGGCPALPITNASGIYNSNQGCTGPTGSEFIWTDATGDQRTDHWGGTGNMDLKEFRLTADDTYLNFLIEFSDITNCNAQYIAIAIDTASGGTTYFPDDADTNLPFGYERVIEANTGATGYWTDNSTFTSVGESHCNDSTNLWEIRMPLSGLGMSWPASSGTYNFAVAIFCHQWQDQICDVGGSSDAMDVITTYSGNTWNEVSDGTLDYSFTMSFGPNPVTLASARARTAAWPLAAALIVGSVALGMAWRRRR